jgi:hypothetical protein
MSGRDFPLWFGTKKKQSKTTLLMIEKDFLI